MRSTNKRSKIIRNTAVTPFDMFVGVSVTDISAGKGLLALSSGAMQQLSVISGLPLLSAWNTKHLKLGTYEFWVDSAGKLRIKNGTPTSDTDGTVVGTQT